MRQKYGRWTGRNLHMGVRLSSLPQTVVQMYRELIKNVLQILKNMYGKKTAPDSDFTQQSILRAPDLFLLT
jgi:hypothetical protein